MYKLLASAAASASLLLLTAVALAGQAVSSSGQVQTLEVHHSSAQATKGKKARGVSVAISFALRRPDGSKPAGILGFSFRLPAGMRFSYKRFPKCERQDPQQKGAKGCPQNSRVGLGSAQTDARPFLAKSVDAKLTAFNGSSYGKPAVLILAEPESSSQVVMPLALSAGGRLLEYRLEDFTLLSKSGLPLTYFTLKLGGKRSVKGKPSPRRATDRYIQNPRPCPGVWRWQAQFSYDNYEQLSLSDEVPCRSRSGAVASSSP